MAVLVRQVDLDPHGPILQVFGLGRPADLPLEDLRPLERRAGWWPDRPDWQYGTSRSGNWHDRPHHVGPRHSQERFLLPSVADADEAPR